MKKIIIILSALFAAFTGFSQSILPEPFPAPPSNSNFYYQNHGQIIDNEGNVRDDVRYYTEKTFPALFLLDDRVSFIARKAADTTVSKIDTMYRIDMQFLCGEWQEDMHMESQSTSITAMMPQEPCGEMNGYEEGQDHLNYCLPHCPTGIEGVKGYARIVYENAFPNIDVHLYSTSSAPKIFFVIHPGGDPNNIHLRFTGQDSSSQITSSSLAMYLGEWNLELPQAYAYQIDGGGNPSLITAWLPLWNHPGGGYVDISTGSYNTAETLVIAIGGGVGGPTTEDNLGWSVYYGDAGVQSSPRIHADKDGIIYHAMGEAGGEFGANAGLGSYIASSDWYVSKFDNTVRQWTTYYGGSLDEFPAAVRTSLDMGVTDKVWVAGMTKSVNVPLGTPPHQDAFMQTANAGLSPTCGSCNDGLLAAFNPTLGTLLFGTYFGGGGDANDVINDMDVDNEAGVLYIVGSTGGSDNFSDNCEAQTTGDFPLCSGTGKYFKDEKSSVNTADGFIAQFNTTTMELLWSTLFGGDEYDEVQVVRVHDNSVYLGGITGSSYLDQAPSPATSHGVDRFPLSNPGGSAFFQNSNLVSMNMFLSKFNAGHQLVWSTLFGVSIGGIRGIEFNSKGQMYILGVAVLPSEAAGSSPNPNMSGLVPVYNNGNSHYQTPVVSEEQGIVLARFNTDLSLGWSTFLNSGEGSQFHFFRPNIHTSGLTINSDDAIFVGSFMYNAPALVYQASGGYWQDQNASSAPFGFDMYQTDNYLLGFNYEEKLKWGTFFGGAISSSSDPLEINSMDILTGMTTHGDFLYLTGITNCPSSPYKKCLSIPFSYCDVTYNPGMDAYISRFYTAGIFPPYLSVEDKNKHAGRNIALKAYPNPSADVFNVSCIFAEMGAADVVLAIMDITGRPVSETGLTLKPGVNTFALDLKGLPPGSYFMHINGTDVKGSLQLVKQ